MKNILVPTDFSTYAHHALLTASQFAKKNDSTLHLLHLMNLPSKTKDAVNGHDANFPEAILVMKNIHSKFEDLKELPEMQGISVHEDVNSEPMPEGVNKSVNENDVDMIVIGSQAKDTTGRFTESNTEKIVRSADVPVLVIKKPTDISKVKNIVFYCTFKDEEIPVLKNVNDFANEVGAVVHILYVNTPGNFKTTHSIEVEMKFFLDKAPPVKHSLSIYNDTTLEKGILNFSNDINADLICLDVHENNTLSRLLNGSITEDLMNHTEIPILSFRLD